MIDTLFPILLLESLVNFRQQDIFSNEKFDHDDLLNSPRYLLSAHHSSNFQTGRNNSTLVGKRGGCSSRLHSYCALRLVYKQISPGHIYARLLSVLTRRPHGRNDCPPQSSPTQYMAQDNICPTP
ncbi:hypothetical protein AVEN_85452-1 [Araneus ventricosus]|uniref:Uncharacterized protein n=1 Tax=Araneus ventricosus TaxID=182803 RepID=A0A4Y2GYK8_ARAVE|nr:hypothetical protein AVEN_85452-1 [Araneus ventricosus]